MVTNDSIIWIPLDKIPTEFNEVTLTEDIVKLTVEYVSMKNNKIERYISFDGIHWKKDASFLEEACRASACCEKCDYKFECWTENNGLKEIKNVKTTACKMR